MAENKQSEPLRFTVTHYRKPEHTHEEFINWIVNKHLPVALPIFRRHGIQEYKLVSSPDRHWCQQRGALFLLISAFALQFTTPANLNEGLKAAMIERRPTWSFADFDCFIEYTLPSLECVAKVMDDPEWPNAVADEPEWVDTSRALCSVGYVTPYLLKTGEVVNMAK
jgi:hypothetical protein